MMGEAKMLIGESSAGLIVVQTASAVDKGIGSIVVDFAVRKTGTVETEVAEVAATALIGFFQGMPSDYSPVVIAKGVQN